MSDSFRPRYPDYDVLEKWNSPSWNDQTREVVGARLTKIPVRRLLNPEEWQTLEAVCARLVPQPERGADAVPIAPFIDAKLFENRGDGYRYEDMPPLREAWRRGLAAINDEAQARTGASFCTLGDDSKDEVLRAIESGDVRADWHGLPPKRFFEVMLKHVVSVYYAHPAAWSEMGFGGPASPRGYVRLGFNRRDSWEAVERHD